MRGITYTHLFPLVFGGFMQDLLFMRVYYFILLINIVGIKGEQGGHCAPMAIVQCLTVEQLDVIPNF